MADEGQILKLREGVDAWNAWQKGNPAVRVDLSGAILTDAILGDVDLFRANLDSEINAAFAKGARAHEGAKEENPSRSFRSSSTATSSMNGRARSVKRSAHVSPPTSPDGSEVAAKTKCGWNAS